MNGLCLPLPTFLVIVLSLLVVQAGAIALAMTGVFICAYEWLGKIRALTNDLWSGRPDLNRGPSEPHSETHSKVLTLLTKNSCNLRAIS